MERAGIRKTKDSGEEVNRETQALTWNLFFFLFLKDTDSQCDASLYTTSPFFFFVFHPGRS